MFLNSRMGRITDEVKDGKPLILESLTFIWQQDSLKVVLAFIQNFPISRPNRPILHLNGAKLKTYILETANFYSNTETFILDNTSNYPRGGQLLPA